jgi:anti-sigma regulatory factor (Ser/Thr protein kinase)
MGDPRPTLDSRSAPRDVDGGERCIYESLLPAVPTSVSRIRQGLDRALTDRSVSRERRADIALVVTEAATNVVVHAYVPRRPGPLYVSAQLPEQTLTVSVVDCGCGSASPSQNPGAGFGLSLMDQLTDALLVRSNEPEPGTSVDASFEDLGGATVDSPAADAVAEMLREYLRVLAATHEALRQDTEAVRAEARQALRYARRCQRNRAGRSQAPVGVRPELRT